MTDEPFACVMFFDSETNEKIAYVALEDDGDEREMEARR